MQYVRAMARDLAAVLGDLAVEMQAQVDPEATLQAIVAGATDIVPGVRWAGISLLNNGKVLARAPSATLVAELDVLQSDLNEGPCLSALRERRTVLIPDMAAESDWPQFARAAYARGVRSLLSFQLFVQDQSLGALNLYADQSDVFDDESVAIGLIVAQHASVALMAAESKDQFGEALASRDVIGQAKGLLMQRNNVTALQAFQMLVRASQETQMKLVDVARWLTEQHEGQINPGLKT